MTKEMSGNDFDDGQVYSEYLKRLAKYGMNTNQHFIYFIMLGMSGMDGETSEDEMESIRDRVQSQQIETWASGDDYDDYRVLDEAIAYYVHLIDSDDLMILEGDMKTAVYGLGESPTLKKESLKGIYNWIKEVATIDGVIKEPEQAFLDFIEELWKLQIHETNDKIDGEEDIDKLCEMLDDENENIRFEAVQKLGKIGDTRTVEPLIEVLREIDDHYHGIPPNQKYFYKNKKIVNAAKIALNEIAPIESLLEALKNYTPRYIGSNCDDFLFEKEPSDSENAIEWTGGDYQKSLESGDFLKDFGASLAKGEEKRKSEDKSKRYEVIKQYDDDLKAKIEKGGMENLTENEWEFWDEQRNWIDDVRMGIAEVLGEKGELAVEPLIRALRDSCTPVDLELYQYREIKSERVARGAAKALGEIGDARAVEPLIEALATKQWHIINGGPGKAAAVALGKIGDVRAVEPLIEELSLIDELYSSNKRLIIFETIIRSLGEIGDVRAVEPLIKLLETAKKDLNDGWGYEEDIIRAVEVALKELNHDKE